MAKEEDSEGEAAELAKLREQLLEPKEIVKDAAGNEFPLCIAECQTKNIRNSITALLRILDPKSHAEYKAMKAADPSLNGKRAAYVFAFQKLLCRAYNVSGLVVALVVGLFVAGL